MAEIVLSKFEYELKLLVPKSQHLFLKNDPVHEHQLLWY